MARTVTWRVEGLLALMMAVVGSSCGSSPSCPNELPPCPSPVPSYKSDIVPIIEASCFPCHATGGVDATKFDFSTYGGVVASKSAVLDQTYGCAMPPAGFTPMPDAARAELLGWLVCGAPNN
jgi:hypothetical protein